jgi:recombination protein RecA
LEETDDDPEQVYDYRHVDAAWREDWHGFGRSREHVGLGLSYAVGELGARPAVNGFAADSRVAQTHRIDPAGSTAGGTDQVEKEKALSTAIQQIERSYGKGSIMKLGEVVAARDVTVIPTGSLPLDLALGVGGMPRGRVVEIYGPESAGKTTLALHVIAEAQRQGGVAAFVDAEHALDPIYASRIGVDIESLLISQPDTGEQALEIVEVLVRSGAVDVIVIDSVAALVPKAEIEGEMGDSHVGLQARLMSQALRKLTAAISKSSTTVIFLNQLREKVGIMFGNPETQPGGRALKFYASVRLDIRKVEVIKSGLDSVGNRVKVKVVKNKVAPPFRSAEFDILFNEGISREGALIDAAVEHGIVEKSGTWMSYGDTRLGQGRENVRNYLRENPSLAAEIEERVRAKAGVQAGAPPLAASVSNGVATAPDD